MTQEDKQLLLKDLCARLPYGVKIHIDFINSTRLHIIGDATLNTITSQTNQTFDFVDFEQDYKNGDVAPIHGFSGGKLLMVGEFKPYLRPMSSMTIDEKMEWFQMTQKHSNMSGFNELLEMADFTSESLDWLNAHHFDYRGLIEKGLALEATKDMYKNELL